MSQLLNNSRRVEEIEGPIEPGGPRITEDAVDTRVTEAGDRRVTEDQ